MNRFIELVQDLPTPFDFVTLLALMFAVVVGLASVILGTAAQIRKYVCYREELSFKRELLDRGMEIDEIERLIAAQSHQDSDESDDA